MRAVLAFAVLFPVTLLARTGALEVNTSSQWARLHQHFQSLALDFHAPPLRILHIGDSHTADAAFSARIRELITQRFGDGGPGFLAPGEQLGHPQAYLGLHQSDGWIFVQERKQSSAAAVGGFVAYSARPYQFLGYKLPEGHRSAQLILYTDSENEKHLSHFKVFYDLKEISPRTHSSNGRATYLLPPGEGHLEILSGSEGAAPRLRGLNLLYETPGISYCAIGVNGASFNILQEWQGGIVRMQMADYQPDLLIVALGTNDAIAPNFTREAFIRKLNLAEKWIGEYAKQTAVLMVLPPSLRKNDVLAQNNLGILREQVRISARKNGWFVWDWSRAMESAGTSGAKLEALYADDGIHLTSAGYSQSARQLVEDLSGVF